MNPAFVIASGSNGIYRIKGFEGVPTVSPGLVFIESATTGAAAWAALLEKELETVLLGSGPNITVNETIEYAADPSQLNAFRESNRQKVLVLIVDQRGIANQPWFAPWLIQKPDRAVLTVFPAGASPTALLPTPALQAINAQFWDKSVTEAIPAMLSLVALSLDAQRIFISYRRLETQPLAEQLFDALTHEGFDVFLDRFSIHPGLNFQERLTQELADKSMVLLLESAWVHTSEWTNHEIQFAKRYQLGLLALQMPDRAEPLGSIDVDLRLPKLTPQDFQNPIPGQTINPEFATKGTQPPTYAQWGPLINTRLKEVVASAKTVHDQAIFRRRRFIRDNVEKTLQTAGLKPQPVRSDGLMVVQSTGDYALWMTTRPPELADFHTTWAKVQTPPGTRGVIIGPTAALEPGRKAKLEWLRDRCSFACIDQDDIPEAARRMKEGSL